MPRSLSPLSVPYRVAQRGGGIAVSLAFAVSGGFDLPGIGPAGPLLLFAIAGVGALALIGYETAYVRRFTYELGDDTLDIESGVVSRRSREIPIRRIQNVDISRNIVQRPLGLAVVSFETAGGGDTEATLRFVSFEEAKRLQATLGRLKRSGAEPTDGDPDDGGGDDDVRRDADSTDPADRAEGSSGNRFDAPPVTELFALNRTELALVGALSIDFRVPGVLFLIVSTVGSTIIPTYLTATSGAAFVAAAAVVLVGIALLSWVVGAAAAIAQYYDFRLVRSGDELQYERGLFQRYDGSIPFDKLQTLTIEDTPLKRYFGYATLLIETAGYAPGQSSGGGRGSEAAVPLAERDRVFELANAIDAFGDPEPRRPPKRVRRRYAVRYLIVVGVLTGVVFGADQFVAQMSALGGLPFPWFLPLAIVPIVPFAAHLKWVHRGYWLGESHVVTRNGVWKRQAKVVPYSRIQTIIDTRTLFQRRWRLATVTIDTAGSLSITGGDAAAVDIDEEIADELRAELDERLREALAARRRNRARRSRAMAAVDGDSGPHPDAGSGVETPVDEADGANGPRGTETTRANRRQGDTNGDTDGFVWGETVEGTADEREAPADRSDLEESDGRESEDGAERE